MWPEERHCRHLYNGQMYDGEMGKMEEKAKLIGLYTVEKGRSGD